MVSNLRDQTRATRYRQLALLEGDQSRATLLNRIADEAERGVLVISDRSYWRRADPKPAELPFQDWIARSSPNTLR
jgi:hypothetical protein